MSTKPYNEPAFPILGALGDHQFPGATLRDYFAAKAMLIVWHAFDEGYTGSINTDEFDSDALAKHAHQIADAMLRARSGT